DPNAYPRSVGISSLNPARSAEKITATSASPPEVVTSDAPSGTGPRSVAASPGALRAMIRSPGLMSSFRAVSAIACLHRRSRPPASLFVVLTVGLRALTSPRSILIACDGIVDLQRRPPGPPSQHGGVDHAQVHSRSAAGTAGIRARASRRDARRTG